MPTTLLATESLRIDKWLWHARFCRTRKLAQIVASKGHLRVNGHRVEKAGARVQAGDIMTLATGGQAMVIRVLGLGERPTMRRDVTRPTGHLQVRRVVRRPAPVQRPPVVDLQRPSGPTSLAAPPGGLQRHPTGLLPAWPVQGGVVAAHAH